MKQSMKFHFVPSTHQVVTLIRSCKTLQCFQQTHVHIIKKGFDQDNYLISNFISRCCNSVSLVNYVTSVFNSVFNPNTCVWNSILKGYCNYSSLFSSLSVFSSMRASSGAPDKFTFPILIKCCSNEGDTFVGVGVHGLLIKYGVEDDVFVGSSLVYYYGKCGVMGNAQKVFDEMSERNEVSWTCMVVGYVRNLDLGNAEKVFDEMPRKQQVAWNAMVSGYVKLGELSRARKVFDEMPFKNVVSYTTMINGYARCGDMATARGLFEECLQKDVFLWSALMSGYAQNGLQDEVLKCFRVMLLSNIKPDEHVMVSVMSTCAQLGNLDLAKEVDLYMNQNSFDLQRTHVVAALVDMNAKCGNLERAMSLFNNMPKRDLVSYCSMIHAHALHGQGVRAVGLFYDMLSEGITPDNVAFTVILTACSHAALVEEGYCFFDMMRTKFSITPSPNHYGCMIDLLGRSGHLEAAYDLLKSLPLEVHAESWGALLGACRLHCDNELAEVVAKRLVELQPHNTSSLVSLSNIYAAADRWLDVSVVRNQMVDRGLKKIAGYSRT